MAPNNTDSTSAGSSSIDKHTKQPFQEPAVGGFQALLSRWKIQDQTQEEEQQNGITTPNRNHIAFYTRRLSRTQAKKTFLRRISSSCEFSSSGEMGLEHAAKQVQLLEDDDFEAIDEQVAATPTITTLPPSVLPPPTAIKKALRAPKNVYQKPLSSMVDHNYSPPSFVHAPADCQLLLKALQRTFCFQDRTVDELQLFVAAFEKCHFAAGDVIIRQGEAADYFYVLHTGAVQFYVDQLLVGQAGNPGDGFGELALLYSTPRAATVIAAATGGDEQQHTRLFRVNQVAFRAIMQQQTETVERTKLQTLQSIDFLQAILTRQDLERLAAAMRLRMFHQSDVLVQSSTTGGGDNEKDERPSNNAVAGSDEFWVLQRGQVEVLPNNSTDNGTTDGKVLKAGDYFGEQALTTNTGASSSAVVARSNGVAFTINRSTFEMVLGSVELLMRRSQDIQNLSKVPFLRQVNLVSPGQLRTLANLVVEHDQNATIVRGHKILKQGERVHPALYIVRTGKVQVGFASSSDAVLGAGDTFGEDLLQNADASSNRNMMVQSKETVHVVEAPCAYAMLSLHDIRTVLFHSNLENPGDEDDEEYEEEETAISPMRSSEAQKIKVVANCTPPFSPQKTKNSTIAKTPPSSPPKTKNSTIAKTPPSSPQKTKNSTIAKTPPSSTQKKNKIMKTPPSTAEKTRTKIAKSPPSSPQKTKIAKSPLSSPRKTKNKASKTPPSSPSKKSKDKKKKTKTKIELPNSLEDVQRHVILGEGTFGQVFLVTNKRASPGKKTRSFALKVQSKHELVMEGQVEAATREKGILQELRHPFIIKLYKTFQDKNFVYSLMNLVQGGELFSVMHPDQDERVVVPESQAKFYALAIADALAFMHAHKYIYRDLKPENVMIDRKGYPVLIDLGFAKKVLDKTYTLCGTPGYLAPEVIMSRGHNAGADHWGLGILMYEMLLGENPFYFEGMDQIILFQSILHDSYGRPPQGTISDDAMDMIDGLLVKDPTMRMGSLAAGESEILKHPWFQSLDLAAMRRRKADGAVPWIPTIKDAMDVACFDDWSELDDKTKQVFPELDESDAKKFDGF